MLGGLSTVFYGWWERLRRSRLAMLVMQPVMIALITANSIFTRERMSHENGLVARGRLRLDPDPAVPANAFFRAGAPCEATLRHASITFADDAALQVRAASLKFSAGPIDSPLDLLMNGGCAAPFWNMDTFWQFTRARMKGGRAHLIDYFKRNPRCYFNVRDALRRDPESYADQHYHSQTPLRFTARDGVVRYAKFRLLPHDPKTVQTGIPDESDLQTPWFQDALGDETRPVDYLRREYETRLEGEGRARYRLQIQLLEWQDWHERDVELSSLYPWDEAEHPWLHLGDVTMDEVVPDPEAQGYLFSLRNLPAGTLGVIPAKGYQDGPSMDRLRLAGWWPRRARLAMLKLRGFKGRDPNPRRAHKDGGADRTTSITRTTDVAVRPSFETGERDHDHYVRTQQLDVNRGLYQFVHGFIRFGTWRREKQLGDFSPDDHPWYTEIVLEGPDDLPDRHTPSPLPPFVRDLTASERYSAYIEGRLYKIIGASVLSATMSMVEGWLLRWKGIEAYRRFYWGYHTKPRSLEHWAEDDAEFARQRVAGTNPVILKRFDEVPDRFPVTDEMVSGLMRPGETIASAIAARRLYWCDYAVLEGIHVVAGKHLAIPMALFYVGAEGRLMPLAIQLEQEGGPDVPIFTPKDDIENVDGTRNWLWTAVKAYVQSADAQVHEVVEHLTRGHLIVEVFDIAMHRALPPAHPVHKLLKPHLEYTMAVNNSARTKMLAPNGPIDRTMAIGAKGSLQLIARAWWDEWDFAHHDVRVDVADRGVGDRSALPVYPWRDDALALWDIVERYVTAMVDHFYADDEAVANDVELTAFHHQIVDPQNGHVRDVPDGPGRKGGTRGAHLMLHDREPGEGFGDKATLVSVLARLVYVASGGHAAVNNGQYDAYGFIPNVPGAMMRPPPRTKAPWSERDFTRALPGFKETSIQITMTRLLSRKTDMPLGTFHTGFFAGTDDVWPIVDRLRRELHELSVAIEKRNAAGAAADAYTYLDPAQVPCSITA